MTSPVIAFSRKRQAWVIYDRPSRRTALASALATTEASGCLPTVWAQRDGQFATKAAAEASTLLSRAA